MLQTTKILFIGFLGAVLLKLVNRTLRWERIGLDGEQRWWADKKPRIILLWHGRLLFMPWIYLSHRSSTASPSFTALISQHHDGRMIAQAMRCLGIDSVAGSSSRGGLRALHSLIKRLRENGHVAITPDGPKGPARRIKDGAVVIAQKSGATIYPSAYAAEKFWRFGSWDGMIFPKPFSRAVMVMGAGITAEATTTKAEFAQLSLSIEQALNTVTARADTYFADRNRAAVNYVEPSYHAEDLSSKID